MRVKLMLENGGHGVSKVVEVGELPAVGSTVMVDRERLVSGAELGGEAPVVFLLVEDDEDLRIRVHPRLRLAWLDAMKASWWDVEDEGELRARMEERAWR